MKKHLALIALAAVLAAAPVATTVSAAPVIAGLGGPVASGGGSTSATFHDGRSQGLYVIEVSNIVAVFTSEPPAALLSAAVVKPDSHGKGRVWLVSGAALDGATLQILGVGSEWGQVLNQASGSIIRSGQAAVALPYVGENGWQLSTGKVVFGSGSWAWASKVWPHASYEAYDKAGNPVNVWGAGTANLGAPAPEAVKAAIRENLPVPN